MRDAYTLQNHVRASCERLQQFWAKIWLSSWDLERDDKCIGKLNEVDDREREYIFQTLVVKLSVNTPKAYRVNW